MINRSIVCAALLAMTLASSCLLAQPFFFRKDIPVLEFLQGGIDSAVRRRRPPDLPEFLRNRLPWREPR